MPEYIRKTKDVCPIVAICYDFDRTLTPDDMQAQGYIQSVGYEVEEFWRDAGELARANDMDTNLAYMYKMIKEAEGNIVFTRQALADYGSRVKLYDGVEGWFDRVRDYGKKAGVAVEHYVISSGLREMIEGSVIAPKFEKIYANSFLYNDRGVAIWPAQMVNYTNKTQFLFRISKGVTDVNDPGVNDYFTRESLRVPFRNMVYIGDSATDIPCMKLVNSYGGHSIGVYDPATNDRVKVYEMMRDDRIRYFAPADYTEGGELDALIRDIITKTAAAEALEAAHQRDMREALSASDGEE